MKIQHLLLVVALSACGGGGDPFQQPPTLTGEAACATIPSIGFGNFFYCPTNQGNLQSPNMPAGYPGFCQTTNESLGLVGYVAYTFSGGFGIVETFSQAQQTSALFGSASPGFLQCTRQ